VNWRLGLLFAIAFVVVMLAVRRVRSGKHHDGK
jgi:hypothetical protein